MSTLVLYDSTYGNTETIAKAIAEVFDVTPLRAVDVREPDWTGVSLLVVGPPTQGGRPTQPLQRILSSIPDGALTNVRVAAFDTRFAEEEHGTALRYLMKTLGYAAPRIAKSLVKKGGTLACPPEGFIVTKKEGPLRDGEVERTTQWAKSIRDARAESV